MSAHEQPTSATSSWPGLSRPPTTFTAAANDAAPRQPTLDGETWIDVGTLADIPIQGSRVVHTADTDIAIFRTLEDKIFALHDRCPHKAGKLSQGIVHGESVTCPLHNWVIGFQDGQAKDPDEGCARTVPVKLENDRILLKIGTP